MSATFAEAKTEASIMARLLEAAPGGLNPGAAGYLLSIRFPDGDVARMNELSGKARQGSLSGEEQVELDSYIHVGNLLALMQSKARRSLSPLTTP